MKKTLSLFLVLVIIVCGCFSAIADEDGSTEIAASNIKDPVVGTFDYSVLKNLDGYDYDAFDKQWSFYRAYTKKYSDAYLVIGLQAWGVAGSGNVEEVQLYVKCLDNSGDKKDTFYQFQFLIDDKLYATSGIPIHGTTSDYVILYDNGYEFVKAIANASSVSVKLSSLKGSLTIELDKAQFASSLKDWCSIMIENSAWDYYEPSSRLASREAECCIIKVQ